MFNLESAIEDWRRRMTAGGIKSAATLDELESHLRDDVEAQLKSGQAAEACFDAAVQRLGRPEALRREFAEAGYAPRFRGWNWLVAVCFAFPILCLARGTIILIQIFGLWYWDFSPTDRVLGWAAVVALILAVCSWLFSHRVLPVMPDRRKRIAMIVACSELVLIWYAFVPGVVLDVWLASPTAGRYIVTMLWLMVLWVMLLGVTYGLEQAARRVGGQDQIVKAAGSAAE
jgi:hypothetical protein